MRSTPHDLGNPGRWRRVPAALGADHSVDDYHANARQIALLRAAKGLLQRGRKVAVVQDGIETLKAEDGGIAIAELQAPGARLVTTEQALARLKK